MFFKICLWCQEKCIVNEQAHLEKIVNRNFTEREWFWPLDLCAPRQKLYALCHFGAGFEAPSEVTIEPKCSCWKALPVCFPTQVEFLNLVPIFPSKNSISQDCFLCVKLGVERSFLGCFWPPEDSKLAQISWPCTKSHYFPWKIQNYKRFLIWSLLL